MGYLARSGARRCYFWLALIYTLLAIYGSFVPFRYRHLAWDAALERWHQVQLFPLTIRSRTDFAANVLLFIPLAFFWMGAIGADRPARVARFAGLLLIPVCAALSSSIEFTQIFFPPRVPAGSDIVGESTGGILGVVVWLAAGQAITQWARRLGGAWTSRELPSVILPGYLIALTFIHVMPMDLTLSPADIYHKYRDGMIILNPFHLPADNTLEVLEKYLWKLALFIPVGCMLAYLPATCWQKTSNWRLVLFAGLALTGVTEFLKLFVMSRYVFTGHVLTGTVGVMGGWYAIRALRTGRAESASIFTGFVQRPHWLAGLVCAWLAFVVMTTWRPFDFSLDPAVLKSQWRRIAVIPFADYHAGTEYNAFDQFFHKVLLYVPLGIFLSCSAALRRTRHPAVLASVLGMMVAAFFEAGQVLLPGRYASITDILVETLGVGLGFWMVCRTPGQVPVRHEPRFHFGPAKL